MPNKQYKSLRQNPPKLTVKKDAREVIIKLISVMCDNKYQLNLRKNSSNDFRLSCNGEAFSNFQMSHDKFEIEWAADESKWSEVFEMINTGTEVIKSVHSR